MKALTIQQPWATLIMLGAKTIETRSWNTRYRGPLLIHAASGKPKLNKQLCKEYPFSEYIEDFFYLPFGKIIGRAVLKETFTSQHLKGAFRFHPSAYPEHEQEFGDYSDGRYGWLLHDIELFKTPIPAKGQLGLWDFDEKLLKI